MINFRSVDEWHIGNNEVEKAYLNGTLVWMHNKYIPFYVQNITNSNEVVTIGQYGSDVPSIAIEKSSDNINWSSLGITGSSPIEFTLAAGERLYLRASATAWSYGYQSGGSYDKGYNFISGSSKIGGNIMSLLYGSNFTGTETTLPSNFCFRSIFTQFSGTGSGHLVDAGSLVLPATTLTGHCYAYMFDTCTLLERAPKLPATTLTDNCYEWMFRECHSLEKAPELPATWLAGGCYIGMFYGCSSLNYIKCLRRYTTGVTSNATNYWVYGVAANGTFIKDPNASWATGQHGIPDGWTVQDAT